MIKILIDNIDYTNQIVGSPTIKYTLSKIDVLSFSLEKPIKNFSEVKVLDDNIPVFIGYYQGKSTDYKLKSDFTVRSILNKIKDDYITVKLNCVEVNIIDFLNTNNQGIKFKSVLNEPLFYTGDISIQNYLQILERFTSSLTISHWYDYLNNVCVIGQPTKKVDVTNDVLLNHDVKFEGIIESEENIINHLTVFGGGLDKLTLSNATEEKQIESGYTVKIDNNTTVQNIEGVSITDNNQTFHIIDESSVRQYGLRKGVYIDNSIKPQNYTQSEREKVSNLLLTAAVNYITNTKDKTVIFSGLQKRYNRISQFTFDEYLNFTDISENNDDYLQYVNAATFTLSNPEGEGYGVLNTSNLLYQPNKERNIMKNIINKFLNGSDYISNVTIPLSTTLLGSDYKEVSFSLPTDITNILTYELYIDLTFDEEFESTQPIDFYLDGENLSTVLQSETQEITRTKRIPDQNLDLLSVVNSSQNEYILDNSEDNKHYIEIINNTELDANVKIYLILKAEKRGTNT